MCYESFYPRKQVSEELQKAKQDADKLIKQVRDASRKPAQPAPASAQTEKAKEESAA